MTVIINTIWGGRVSQVVDRQISKVLGKNIYGEVDRESNKVCIVLARDALVSIAYTGIAIAHGKWIDCVIANCLAHREVSFSLVQPGSPFLARPIHTIIKELSINLNGKLNSDDKSRPHDLQITIVGWHLSKKLTPLAWELYRGPKEDNGNRYFKLIKYKAGKFFRESPNGIWGETLGNPGSTIDEGLKSIVKSEGYTHDDVERKIRDLIKKRSKETKTVSPECIAVQLDKNNPDGQVQVTFYSSQKSPLLIPWIMTPRMICAPSVMSSSCLPTSECGYYAVGGFDDCNTNLSVQARIPKENTEDFSGAIVNAFKKRKDV
jgi:hypothetical protein